MYQTHCFETEVCSVELVADSALSAFYNLKVVEINGAYTVVKESGARGKLLDRREWTVKTRVAAQKMFRRKLNQKINPDRNSPRRYKIVRQKGIRRFLDAQAV